MLPCCLCCKYTLAFSYHYIFRSCCFLSIISMLCRFIASPLSVRSLMFVLFCSALSSLLCLLLACLYLGPCVFSAVPVPPPPGVNIEEHIQIRQEEKRQRINRRHRLEEGRGMDQGDRGYIFGLYRFRFMNLEEMNDRDWWKIMRQDQRLLNMLCPFHFFFPQALITFRC